MVTWPVEVARRNGGDGGRDEWAWRSLGGRRGVVRGDGSPRVEARRIVADDPLLARDRKIGRPDLARDYDDGGLVDLNSAPAAAIEAVCGLDPAMTERIVAARAAAGVPFAQVDDVFAYTDIPVELWDRIRDRAVAIHA